MIVRSVPAGLQLITQPDHAHLAGRLMQHCVALVSRPRQDSILQAIAEHDNGWIEEDAAPTVHADTGFVADFINAPILVRHGVWPRGVARLAADPWAAALVAQHAVTVYERYREDAAWRSFFSEMEATRDALVRRSGAAHADLAADYVFVRLADLISLTFCLGWSEEQQVGKWVIRRSGTNVGVRPDPFGGATIALEITAREIPNERYVLDADLRDALSRARTVTLRGSCIAL